MMVRASLNVKSYIKSLFLSDGDPIEVSQRMVNFIQGIVGIRDIFGTGEKRFTITSVFCILIFYGCFAYMGTFSQMVYLIGNLDDKVEMFKALDCLSATSVPTSMYIFMWTSRQQLKLIFDMCRRGMSALPPGSATTVFQDTLRKAHVLAWLVVANQFFVHITYLLVPFLMTLFGSQRHLPLTPGDIYGLSPKYITPNFELTFVITTLSTNFSAVNQTGYTVLFLTVLAHELGHFYAINETLNILHEELTNGFDSEEERDKHVEKTLVFCIRHHQFIAELHDLIKNLYRGIFMAHFFIMIVVLVTTLQTMNDWDFRNTLLTGITGILPLFVYCFGGELVISACEEMSVALYGCGWDRMRPKHAKVVLLMLRLAQRPLLLTAADIFIMNRDTFGNVTQLVYKVYTVFN